MKVLQNIGKVLDEICGFLIVLMIGAMVIITTAQIICRIWFTALSWSEEVTRFLLIWSTFLGATCVYRRGGNIAITAVQGLFPEKVQKVLRVLVHIVCFVLFAVLLYYGILYCNKQVRTAAALPIKMKYIYMCLPIGLGICMYHAFVMALEEIFQKKEA
ncbi:MAG: TRAP transporter small permease [Oscillospiraceae bacterium]|nr:TRAP transporter small permease [Oscillospiraceae bacterium]